MIFSNNHKLKSQLKGIKQILKERNLWLTKNIHLIYKQCSEKYNKVNSERLNYCI